MMSQAQSLSGVGQAIIANQPGFGKTKTMDNHESITKPRPGHQSRASITENFDQADPLSAQFRHSKDNNLMMSGIKVVNDNAKRVYSEQIPQSEPLMQLIKQAEESKTKTDTSATSGQPGRKGLLFGFLSADLVAGLNESNQWKDRT